MTGGTEVGMRVIGPLLGSDVGSTGADAMQPPQKLASTACVGAPPPYLMHTANWQVYAYFGVTGAGAGTMQPPQKLASTACARPPPFRMQTDPWQLCEYCTGAAVSSTDGAAVGTTGSTAVTHLAAAHVSTAVGLGPWQRNSVESRSSESDKQYLWHQVLKSS